MNLDLPQEVAPKVELSSVEQAPDVENNIQLSRTETPGRMDQTNTKYIIKNVNNYNELFDKLKNQFITCLMLENKEDLLYPKNWLGRVNNDLKKTQAIANLNDFSIFKILKKGLPYHGFPIKTQSNEDFFNHVGWENYPEHVTAIPLKINSKDLIFVGFSIHKLDIRQIQNIEQTVLDHFFETGERLAA